MDPFTHPPSFLQPLLAAMGNISKWFDWNALEAVGTVGALWFAVVQSSRSARLERLRAIGVLTVLVGLIEPVTEAIPEIPYRAGGMLQRDEVEFLLGADEIIQRALDGLTTLSHAEAIEIGAVEWVSALPLALSELIKALPITADDKARASDFMSARYVVEACDHFRLQRDYLRYGLLGVGARRVFSPVISAYWKWRYRNLQRLKAPERA